MITLESALVVDVETDEDELVAIGVSGCLEGEQPVTYRAVPEWVAEALASPDTAIVEHTLYDANFLERLGFVVTNVVDTRALAHGHNAEGPFDLEALAYRYCGIVMDKRIKRESKVPKFRCDDGSKVRIKDAPWDQLTQYLRGDVEATVALVRYLFPLVDVDRISRFTNILLDMETNGLPYNERQRLDLEERYRRTLAIADMELLQLGNLPENFNFNSGDQLAAFLYLKEFNLDTKLLMTDPVPEGFVTTKEAKKWRYGTYKVQGKGLPIHKWTGEEPGQGVPATDAKTLAVHYGGDPWVKEYLVAAKYRTALSWLEKLPTYTRAGRVYGRFNQAGTVTGRLSSSNPNLQNIAARGEIGKSIRGLFQGDLIVADFSQLEPRIAAHLSQDPVMLDIFRSGKDIYRVMGAHVFQEREEDVTGPQRDVNKLLVLSMFYGAKAGKTAENLSVAGFYTPIRVAKTYLEHIEELFPVFFQWREDAKALARKRGYTETIGGRRRELKFEWGLAWKDENRAVNTPIQGSAADIVEGTMVFIDEYVPVKMLVQVHDEVVMEPLPQFDMWEDEYMAMISAAGYSGHGFELSVPLVFEPKRIRSWVEK